MDAARRHHDDRDTRPRRRHRHADMTNRSRPAPAPHQQGKRIPTPEAGSAASTICVDHAGALVVAQQLPSCTPVRFRTPTVGDPSCMTTTKMTNTAPRRPRAAVDGVDRSTRSASTIVATGDFSVEWLTDQHAALLSERQALTGQAQRLEDEASALLDDGETGDVKFDDEGAEGDGMAVERDRDLMLSAQARETVAEIDAALDRMAAGTYGYSVQSGRPHPARPPGSDPVGHAARRGEARRHRTSVTNRPRRSLARRSGRRIGPR